MKRTGPKPLSEQVIVITGASSGIGLATAQEAARGGAKLILAARNEAALSEIVDGFRAGGTEAFYVVADVSVKADLLKIYNAAIEHFGGFDTWVNNAGTSIIGKIEDVSEEDHRRLFEVNFWSIVNGSLLALQHLKHHGGTIINLGRQVSDAAIPLQGMYSATKHAIKGFTDALRLEIEKSGYPVSLTLIKPSAIATPFFEHAKNYTPEAPKAPEPNYKPEEVAKAIAHAATHRVRDLNVGGAGKVMNAIYAMMPGLMDSVYKNVMFTSQLSDKVSHQEGNLYQAGRDGQTTLKSAKHPQISLYTRAKINPVVTGVTLATLAVGAAALLHRRCNLSTFDKLRRVIRL
jgi:short-subunit dehydrogenase